MITKVGPHLNTVQRDLSIPSRTFLELDSKTNTFAFTILLQYSFHLFPFPHFFQFVSCITGMAAKLLSLYLLAVAGLGLVQAGKSAS
jgi:hypothetical protein